MPQNTPENEDDFIRMQQEAIRRVREMQERARRTLEDAGMPITPGSSDPFASAAPAEGRPPARPPGGTSAPPHPSPQRPPAFIPPPPGPPSPPAAPPGGLPMQLLQSLQLPLQNDQLLLMGLIYLLYRDGSDIYLILALAFILLT